ncbi:Expansin-like EG45 domain-containing protein [Mycena kentingensis (nom. inval.)]|nr:Expansin-like EG45 domain-containing protein [Mycena kentingensis (nom. inval.)]
MNATKTVYIENRFGPPSQPIDVAVFKSQTPAVPQLAPQPPEIAAQCDVSDIRESLNTVWDDVELSSYLLKSHDTTVTAFHNAGSKTTRKKKPAVTREAQGDTPATKQLQAVLDAVPLECWKLQNTATIFIRPVKWTDQNILLHNKPTSADDGRMEIDENEVVLTFTIHTRSSWRQTQVVRSSRLLILSSQTLGDLFDAILCPSAEMRAEIHDEGGNLVGYEHGPPTRPGCVVCMEGLAYGDGESEVDYADKLIQHLQNVPKEPGPAVKKAPTAMHDTALASLTLRIGQPYWLMHHGNCEHILVCEQMRLQHPSDPTSGYPITTHIPYPQGLESCRVCNKFQSEWSILNDERLAESPCAMCDTCWKALGEAEGVIAVPLPKYELVCRQTRINASLLPPHLNAFPAHLRMALSTTALVTSLEESDDVVGWINDTLDGGDSLGLTDLDQQLNRIISTLEIAQEDTSSELERIIEDVSRGVPRLAYDLHFMKDGAVSLQSALAQVTARSKEAIPAPTRAALDRLRMLDMVKGRMEAARDVLREAESWSTLELEVTSLLAEKSYAKAAERLSEASRSMAVFQNTPEYDPRKTLMVNLQNQLEAALSSALVAAINVHDLTACRNYFAIFTNIQRESEFRNYYYGSRRAGVVAQWQDTRISDCDVPPENNSPSLSEFVPKFYASFLELLNVERLSIPSIFPDPSATLSNMISSILSALQPTFSQRLSSILSHYGDSALRELIPIFRSTEEFASNADHVMEKIRYSSVLSPTIDSPNPDAHMGMGHRRRSSRLSMSWRTAPTRSTSSGLIASKSTISISSDNEWEQELFQPFLDFQVDYGTLERRLLDHALREIIENDTREDVDRARLLRERTVDVFSVAEDSASRCVAFTHGYGAIGLVQGLDGFFQSFIDTWTAEVRAGSSHLDSTSAQLSAGDLADLDYSAQDWADIQLLLHLMSSARAMFDRLAVFDNKLRASLVQIATTFRLAQTDPHNFVIAPSKGESELLRTSTLQSAELEELFKRVDPEPGQVKDRAGAPIPSATRWGERRSVFVRKGVSVVVARDNPITPASSSRALRVSVSNELHVPTFSLSTSETISRVAESLLSLPRLFEDNSNDDALSFSLHTLPHIDPEILKTISEHAGMGVVDASVSPGHKRRQSLTTTPKLGVAAAPAIDSEVVASAWLSSLGHSLLRHLTTSVLPNIATLSVAGAAQLASDLGYLSTIVRALNVEFEELERWKELAELDDEEGRKRVVEGGDTVLNTIARMRGWTK